MTMLEDLVEGASGQDLPVATLLRKVKVVAARLKTVPLERWVDHELMGYRAGDELPDYRGSFDTPVFGTFGGPFGSGLVNAPIPKMGFPPKYRDGPLFHMELRQPVAELERLAKGSDALHANWPADVVAYTNQLIERGEVSLYPGMGLQQAWQSVSPHHLAAVVDTVRTRILDLALSLEAIAPDAGQPDAPSPNHAELDRVIMNVYGGNVAVASSHVTQSIAMPDPGNKGALFAALRSYGLEESVLTELSDALDADGTSGDGLNRSGMGARVKAWAGDVALKGAAAAGTAAGADAGHLALRAVAAYFGVHVS